MGTALEVKEVWLKHCVRCWVNLVGSRGGEGGVAGRCWVKLGVAEEVREVWLGGAG